MQLGFIGTGLMGQPMAERLLKDRHTVTVYNRTPHKLAPLTAAGAIAAASPAALLEATEATLVIVTNAAAIRETLLSDAARPYLAGHTIVQMSTIAPQESQAICQAVLDCGGHYLEAPVLGSIPEAQQGTLQIMVGASPADFEKWTPLLSALGPNPQYIGPVGTATALKLALNQLIASLTTAFSSSLGLCQHYNVPIDAFMQILRQSALYAPTFDKKLDRMLSRNFDNPNFPAKHLLKDIQLFLDAAEPSNLNLEAVRAICGLLETTTNHSPDRDYSVLFETVYPRLQPEAKA
jgi:3-hydroxyisobutyrate dehydrogenase